MPALASADSHTRPDLASVDITPALSSTDTTPDIASADTRPDLASTDITPALSSTDTMPDLASADTTRDTVSTGTSHAPNNDNDEKSVHPATRARRGAVQAIQHQAKRMLTRSTRSMRAVEKGDNVAVRVPVPTFDRSKGDHQIL